MRSAAALVLVGLIAVPLAAQERESRSGIDRGQLPPPGQCRVWYDDRPAGQQPPPTSCPEAERTAARDGRARVIYSEQDNTSGRNGDWRDRDGDRYPDRADVRRVPFDNGYRDGYEKGRQDARNDDAHDPERHAWYRSGDRGYNTRYGSRESYRTVYREGFRDGYENGYRDAEVNGETNRRGGFRLPWPF